jgi:hypothetical protein
MTGEVSFNLQYTMNGCLSGLVAITPACSVVDTWASFVIGSVAGALYLGGSKLLVKWRIDDAVDAIPVHVSLCLCFYVSVDERVIKSALRTACIYLTLVDLFSNLKYLQ